MPDPRSHPHPLPHTPAPTHATGPGPGPGPGTNTDAHVLVVGAGPVGLTLALDLARRGLTVRVLERSAGTFEGSRAKGLQPRTLEVLDDLGLAAEARAAGGPYPRMGVHLGPFTASWRLQRPAAVALGSPYPDLLLLPQYALTALLHRAVVDGPAGRKVRVEFGITVEDVDQDAETASVRLSDGRTLRGRYVVGADGGGSTVRRAAGIPFPGHTDDADRMILADAVVDGLTRDRWHVWPRPGGRVTGACPLPGGDRFQLMFKLAPDEPAGPAELTEEALRDRLRHRTGNGSLTLRALGWTSVFRPNVRLADRYRRGRVLLCGDAAHVYTPAGAQGLNTGVQDAYNLGWKLRQVLAGAPDALLDSYEGERRPIAARVLGRSTELYEGMRRGRPGALTRGREEHQLHLSYAGGPLAPPPPPGTDRARHRTNTLRPGDRAPDAALPYGLQEAELCPDGLTQGVLPGRDRLFDLTRGPHFTALAFGPRARAALDRLPWPTHGAPLHRHALLTPTPTNGGKAPAPPRATRRLRAEREERLMWHYGITCDTLLILRPDGHLAHIDTAPGAPPTTTPATVGSAATTATALPEALRAMTPPL
ncbi:FAD-dependent oxidoreductase [Streptomyces sp. NPDC097619]|uniref:FAD-dependent oxidoreductase n=1 Tax=Streptomyces sp. NPDC097619 TaxID=3157228 RepID=UPI00332BC36F